MKIQNRLITWKSILVLIFYSISILGCGKNRDSAHTSPSSPKDSRQVVEAERLDIQVIARISNSEAVSVLNKCIEDWGAIAVRSQGKDTLAKQRELALSLIPKLGASDELLKFLNFLTERGAGDLSKEIIEEHLGAIFTGPGAKKAREWLLTVRDDKLRALLCKQAGLSFSGMGFKDYFEKMGDSGDHRSQAALLRGYCMALAKSDPEAALKVYADLGYPKRIDNTGLAEVYASMPPTIDFLKFATGIKEDSLSLAKRCRTALLQNWAKVNPQDAAQYVISNTNSGVAPDQMAQVVSAWATTSPDSAGTWLDKAPEGKAKDEGSAALAKYWLASDPVKAWDCAAKVGDFKKRVETATLVFKDWEKTDRDAATRAWTALFPANP